MYRHDIRETISEKIYIGGVMASSSEGKQGLVANIIAGTVVVSSVLGSAFALTWLFAGEFSRIDNSVSTQEKALKEYVASQQTSLREYADAMQRTVRRLESNLEELTEVYKVHSTVINNHEVRISLLEAKSNE
ncbi:hypothetical protein [Endozoicomonas sp. ALC066]|uniref:hypothetical protein n=1 Tax=Endozoicomonas sp. ALC066 TaxID=3403078 RepID=UPI003BB5EB76